MSKNYSVNGIGNTGTVTKTGVELRSTSAIRAGVWGWLIGQAAAPNSTDFNLLAALTRFTTQGAGSAGTVTAIDGGDVAAVNTAVVTNSGEPGIVASDMMQNPPNQRTNFFWQTYDGRELWSVAATNNGICARMVTAGQTIALNHTVWFRE